MLPAVNDESLNDEVAGLAAKRPKLDRNVDTWVQNQFQNPARQDQLQLVHWVKETECDEPYQFARFNRKAEVISYSDEEYKNVIEQMS